MVEVNCQICGIKMPVVNFTRGGEVVTLVCGSSSIDLVFKRGAWVCRKHFYVPFVLGDPSHLAAIVNRLGSRAFVPGRAGSKRRQ